MFMTVNGEKKGFFSDSVHVNVHILPGYLKIQILTFFFHF